MIYKVWVNVPAYIDVVAENKEEAADRAAALIDECGIDALTTGEICGDNICIDNVEE